MRKRVSLVASTIALAAVVAACVGEGRIKWENTPIGSGEGVFKIEFKNRSVDPPANPKKVGDAIEVKSSKSFDILDVNGNEFPDDGDLLRDPTTGRCYPIKSLKRVGGTQSVHGYEVVLHETARVAIPFEWGPGTAEEFLRGHGFDALHDGEPETTLHNVRPVWFGPWSGIDTPAVVAVAYSSRFRMPDSRKIQGLGSELHSRRASNGELFFVEVLQGRLDDIVLFLAEMGMRTFTAAISKDLYVRAQRDPDATKREVKIYVGKAEQWLYVATLGY